MKPVKWKCNETIEMLDHDMYCITIVRDNGNLVEFIQVISDSTLNCKKLAEKTTDALNNYEFEFENQSH